MKRRNFLAGLASLPALGFLKPKCCEELPEEIPVKITTGPELGMLKLFRSKDVPMGSIVGPDPLEPETILMMVYNGHNWMETGRTLRDWGG